MAETIESVKAHLYAGVTEKGKIELIVVQTMDGIRPDSRRFLFKGARPSENEVDSLIIEMHRQLPDNVDIVVSTNGVRFTDQGMQFEYAAPISEDLFLRMKTAAGALS